MHSFFSKKVYFALATLLLSFVSWPSSQTNAATVGAFADQVGLFIVPRAGVDLLELSTVHNTDNFVGFEGGVEGDYFLTKNIGLGLGVDFLQRGLVNSGNDLKAWFADINFGPVFAWKGFLPETGRSHFSLGGYYAIPFANYGTDSAGDEFDSKGFFGIRLAGDTLFAINQMFSLGFGSWFKFGLGPKAVTSPDGPVSGGKFYEIGIGLVSTFQPMPQY